VYEQAGYIHLVDLPTGQSKQLAIEVTGDLPWARPQFKKVAGMIRNAVLSPTGVRAAFEARGEIFTVPAEKGDWRNVTRSAAVHDRDPVWSPDGAQIAWFSDASGEYQLMVGDQAGLTKPRAYALPAPVFYSEPAWAPSGKQILFQDNDLNLWTLDVATGQTRKLDTDAFDTPGRRMEAVWSPDSRWVAYSKSLTNHMRAIFVYSLTDGKASQVTDGMSDAESPAFDEAGKYLYFLASTDYGPRTGWLEMSSVDRPVRRSVYLAVLSASEPSPLLPEVVEEPTGPAAPKAKPDTVTHIDVRGIGQRIISLNIPPGDYASLAAGPTGTIFYSVAGEGPGAAQRLQRYQLKERTAAPFLEGIRSYSLSGDRKKLLYSAGSPASPRWGSSAPTSPPRLATAPSTSTQLEMQVDPRAEWAQIFRESWRIERDYFYDPKMHGADWTRRTRSTARCFLMSVIAPTSAISWRRWAANWSSDTRISPAAATSPRRRRWPADCWARTSPSRTGGIASVASIRARTGTPTFARR